MLAVLFLFILFTDDANTQHDPLFHKNHSSIVSLFEWPFDAIAQECEYFLGPNGFGGVQISPVAEHVVLPDRPWTERYQPVSYKMFSRSGNESELIRMTQRCNAAGVRVYVDVVLNHMAKYSSELKGFAGSLFFENRSYPAVPYVDADFHRPCIIDNHNDAHKVRNCYLYGLPDLDQSKETVRRSIVTFLNRLIDFGVAGFRVGTCKNMWPNDLKNIYSRVKNVSTEHGFPPNTRPFFYQEILDTGRDPVSKTEYTFIGAVSEYMFARIVGQAFLNNESIKTFEEFGPSNGFVHSADAVVYLDTHDLQRQEDAKTISFKHPRALQTAYVYMFSHSFGFPFVMSSYFFENDTMKGPPMKNGTDNVCSPIYDNCRGSWVFEHRWPIIAEMIQFKIRVGEAMVRDFRSYGPNQVVFCRGQLGFVAFNNSPTFVFDKFISMCLPPGNYCDVTSIEGEICRNMVWVSPKKIAHIVIPLTKKIPAVVLYVGYIKNSYN